MHVEDVVSCQPRDCKWYSKLVTAASGQSFLAETYVEAWHQLKQFLSFGIL
jgi:hypothetical protein